MANQKTILIIMDGWGIAEDKNVSAIEAAKTPFYDKCLAEYPHIRLQASGLAVGLPEGQMGNSEVGHMNIGAGRIVYQELVRINLAIKEGSFEQETAVQNMIQYCQKNQKPLHLLGLISDGGVHSHIEHLKGLLTILSKYNLPAVYLHLFTDGRDTDPNSGLGYIESVNAHIAATKTGQIASLIGRYYAMDRDKRWERVKLGYDLLVKGEGTHFETAEAALQSAYNEQITDEFLKPAVIGKGAKIEADDAVFFFNFRTDRGREITEVLTQSDKPEYDMKTLPLNYTTMTRYDASFKNVNVVYEKDETANGLGEYLANCGKEQIRIAETEKYPHVTFFFNGGREEPFQGEKRLMRASPKVATYDLQPEMSAFDLRDAIIPELTKGEVDFVCLNFANPDMVGHTGVFSAAVKACEVVDSCTQAVAETALKNGYNVLITADHGNSDKMCNADGSPNTAHTTALVPLILLQSSPKFTFTSFDKIGKLGDLAPTILTLMGLAVPKEMTGEVLVTDVTHSY
jgi:2,3-bisphosphoglycerate-independent phosphoglycerate mutase